MTFTPKNIAVGIATAIPAALILMSGIFKLSGGAEVRTALAQAGVGPYIVALGTMELLFTALFLYPKTMKLGVLLLTAYFAGAIATDISHGRSPVAATVILTLVWVAAFLRDRTLFLPPATPPAPAR